MVSTIEQISERFSVVDALNACDIAHDGSRKSIACPIHGDRQSGKNFSIFNGGELFKCHSRDCGHPHRRDGINLYSMLRYGAPLPALDREVKGKVIRETARLAGVALPERGSSGYQPNFERNIFKRNLSLIERMAFNKLLAGEITPNECGLIGHGQEPLFTSKLAGRILLFCAIAESENQLPPEPMADESFMSQLINFLGVK